MAYTPIKGKPLSFVRVAVTDVDTEAAGADCIPCISPAMAFEASQITYDVVSDNRFAFPSQQNKIFRTLQLQSPFAIPTDAENGISLISHFYNRFLIPAGYESKVEGTTTTYSQADDWSSYNPVDVYYQEYTEQEAIKGAYSDFSLTFDTSDGMLLDVTYTGEDGGVEAATALDNPAIAGKVPVFENAELYIYPASQAIPTDPFYLPCKSFTFEQGNSPTAVDDCNKNKGVGDFYIGNQLTEQKVTFDVAAPKVSSGSTITADAFPWQYYFKNSTEMQFKLKLDGGPGAYVEIGGVFTMDSPARSDSDDLRRLSISGVISGYGKDAADAFSIAVTAPAI